MEFLEGQFVVVLRAEKFFFFSNNADDTGDGVLCMRGAAEIPLFVDSSMDAPVFVGLRYFPEELPRVGTEIVCQVVRTDQGRLKATSWTTRQTWDAAAGSYKVIRHTAAGAEEIWSGDGIFALSILFPTHRCPEWDENGTIYRDGEMRLQIVELLTDDEGHYDEAPERDPRVPVEQLNKEHRGYAHASLR